MKTYHLYIKSHCEAPDYEDWCIAESKEEAAKFFAERINTSSNVVIMDDVWYWKDLLPYIFCSTKEEEEIFPMPRRRRRRRLTF